MSSHDPGHDIPQLNHHTKASLAFHKGGQWAYDRVGMYLRLAHRQMDRIERAMEDWEKSPARVNEPSKVGWAESSRRSAIQLQLANDALAEVHLYFSAITIIDNMLVVVTAEIGMLESRKELTRHRAFFESCRAARNSFEHYEGGFPGRPDEKKLFKEDDPSRQTLMWGLSPDVYTRGFQKWDISRASLARLVEAVEATMAVVHRLLDEKIPDIDPATVKRE
jgi:hypothetical protein